MSDDSKDMGLASTNEPAAPSATPRRIEVATVLSEPRRRPPAAPSAAGRLFCSIANLAVAALLCAAVYMGLPVRYWLVDGGTALTVLAYVVAAVALWVPRPAARRIARSALAVVLIMGMLTVVGLCTSLGALQGVHGPVSQGAQLIFVLVLALVLPYLVLLPGAELRWLSRHESTR